jgi:hypothetical protein
VVASNRASKNCCANSFARLTGSGRVRAELGWTVEEGDGEGFAGVGKIVPNIGGTDAPVTYTVSGLEGRGGCSGIDELRSYLARLEGGSGGGDELRLSSGYVLGIVASDRRPSEEKTLRRSRLGDDHDGAVHDGVRWGGLDEARKRESLR